MYALMSTVTEYATSMGSTATVAGLVSGIYIFGGLCSRIYSGNALERIGWRRTALIFMTIHFAACFLYFFVNDVSMLLIVRFIHGIGFGASANAIVTIATAILPKKRYGEAFGYFMIGTTLAVGLGPFIGGILYDYVGSIGCFLAATIFCAIALICVYLIDISSFDPINNVSSMNNQKKKPPQREVFFLTTFTGGLRIALIRPQGNGFRQQKLRGIHFLPFLMLMRFRALLLLQLPAGFLTRMAMPVQLVRTLQ